MHGRPLASVPIVKEIPVIDLGEEQTVVAQQLVKALEEYGFFRVQDYFMDVIGAYSSEVRKLSMIIFDLVRKGLGLEEGYFGKEHKQKMIVHHFPVCPDPSSTLGMDGHCDPNLITIYQQQVYGLQILKNEEWIGVTT
ncbi:hypothetical protein MTR67_042855 [Solanum verrucosum]|uniref:Isopenicillin N synthase-like Fe(2+) 2OG dioxygenase domain-containing protein n=1 Tax=Solanum verrucosum TaxID=315347 RepID=A0AAF0UP93_SOLVR|nr:hypothetical protein MTR67_042855 [Solanum verrucosum]